MQLITPYDSNAGSSRLSADIIICSICGAFTTSFSTQNLSCCHVDDFHSELMSHIFYGSQCTYVYCVSYMQEMECRVVSHHIHTEMWSWLHIPHTDYKSEFCSVLFFSRPRSEGWPHHVRTFSIYLCLSTESPLKSPRLDVVNPGRAWSSSPACTWHCSLHYLFLQATPLFGNINVANYHNSQTQCISFRLLIIATRAFAISACQAWNNFPSHIFPPRMSLGSSIKDVRSEGGGGLLRYGQMRTRGGFDSMQTCASQLRTKACRAGVCSCMAILITPTVMAPAVLNGPLRLLDVCCL